MFTGIVEIIAKIESQTKIENNIRIAISLDKKWKLKMGDSVAVSGVCLTVAEIKNSNKNNLYYFDMIPETLVKTIFGKKIPEFVNIERPLVYGARVHGHIVSGHVNCAGKVVKVSDDKMGYRIEVSFPTKFKKYLVEKGSVVIDGVSLTVVEAKASSLVVALVPHTRKITTLSNLKKGDMVNLEFDLLNR